MVTHLYKFRSTAAGAIDASNPNPNPNPNPDPDPNPNPNPNPNPGAIDAFVEPNPYP